MISQLVGKTLSEIRNAGDEIIFITDTGEEYKMYHSQDCCESVYIEDIDGDLQDLIGNPILEASGRSNSDDPKEQEYPDDSFTWTFYIIRNVKASVTIRWYGSSNGYYSESVDFVKID